jgi:hypothetical protein
MIELAKAGVQSDQDRVQAETNLQAAQATVQAQQELVKRGGSGLGSRPFARTQQADAAKSTVQSTEADLKNAIAQKDQACSAAGLHQCLCAGHGHGFRTRRPAGRSRQHRRADRHNRRFERHVGACRNSRDLCRPHRLWRLAARAHAGWNGNERQSVLQGSGKRLSPRSAM